MTNHYQSLSKQLGIRLIIAFVIGLSIFSSLSFFGTHFLDNHFSRSRYIYKQEKTDIEKFQSFVNKKNISATDTDTIYQWFKKKDFSYMSISRNNALLFDSIYIEENITNYSTSNISDAFKEFYHTVSFADGDAKVYIYNNYDVKFYVIYYVMSFALSTLVFFLIFLFGLKRRTDYIQYLSKAISLLEAGYWNEEIQVKGNDDLSYLGCSINNMRKTILENTKREALMQQSQNNLVTSIAHDLRTPLTSLMTYLDLLKRQELSQDSIAYIEKCTQKSIQIKDLSDQLFEYFYIHSQTEHESSSEYVHTVLDEPLSELAMILQVNGFQFIESELNFPEMKIKIIPCHMQRILDNIISNIKKYADKQAPIYLSVSNNPTEVLVKFSNSPAPESSNSSKCGIGLRNVQDMMEQMDGKCIIEDGSFSFSITLVFQICP